MYKNLYSQNSYMIDKDSDSSDELSDSQIDTDVESML
jgi:hypothetical protein